MANFAKEQLIKYGWTEGKGLGKNENGITEPVKLATNQNKAGIGYDEAEPWWDKLFNNAVKNVKVESHGDEVSLSVGNYGGASTPLECTFREKTVLHNWHNWQKFVVPGSTSTKTWSLTLDDKLKPVCCYKTVHKTTGHNLTLGGKLGRIAEQDRILLNKSLHQLNTTLAEKNDMAYRKTNVESDVEEKEHEIDNNESIVRSEAEICIDARSKSIRKRIRRRINKLTKQLHTCNLEKSSVSHDSLNTRKLCQTMKKNKERKLDPSVFEILKDIYTNKSKPVGSMHKYTNKSGPVGSMHKYTSADDSSMKRLKILFEDKKRIKELESEDKKGSVRYNLELSPELRNIITGNGVTDKRRDNWILTDVQTGFLSKDIDHCTTVPVCSSKQDVPKLKNTVVSLQHKVFPTYPSGEVEMGQRFMCRLNNKIQKKKDQRYRSKHMKKIAEKLKGEALSHELNSVIKNFTTFDLAEEVNANTIKKRPTQTHLTPV